MERRARHMEWAKLKLAGLPLMSGASWEPHSLLWVAIRPLPRLLHVYLDSNLQEVLQFAEDLVFLLFIPPKRGIHAENKKSATFPSLLVITDDGCIWRIPLADSVEDSSTTVDRCSKRLKRNQSERMNIPTSQRKSAPKQDEWDIFDDWDIYKDIELYPSQTCQKESSASSKAMLITWKPLQLRTCGILPNSRRPQIRFVSNNLLVGKLPGAHIAAVGPENLIAVVSPSTSPLTFMGNLRSVNIPPEREVSPAVIREKPSCLLILSQNRYKSQWDGPCISDQLFNAFCPSTSSITIDHLLLQGDMAGTVSVFPMQHSGQKVLPSMVLCDLKEPICELVATTLFQADALIVISSLGRISIISAAKHENVHNSSAGLLSQSVKLFQIDKKDGFFIYDWRVPGPVVSPVMNGSKSLCFCSSSGAYIVDLLDVFDNNVMLNSATHEKEAPQQVTIKRFLKYKAIPIDDSIISLVGKGSSSSAFNSRPLVALTSRGRLIAIETSDHVLRSQSDVFMPRKHDKSWKPVVKKREEHVKELINDIAVVEEHTDGLHQMTKHIDIAVSEISSALWLCYNVINSRNVFNLHASDSSTVTSSMAGLACNIEIHPVVLCVSTGKLCFGPWSHVQMSSSDYDFADNTDFKLHVKVHLSNHGSYPISSFWVLMLELQYAGRKGNMRKLYFSNIINDGYGIAGGASSTIEFDIPWLENYVTPVMGSVFLCHLHENHSNLAQGLSTINSRIPSIQNMWKPLIKKDILSPGAVVIAVATFRVDMLSLLRKPKILQHLSANKFSYSMVNSLRTTAKKLNNDGERFGHFSERFRLIDRLNDQAPSWDTLPIAKKWKDCSLEDLVPLCSVSMDGQELTSSDPSGNRVIFTIDGSQVDKNNLRLKEIHIAADSLILGCLIRESVLSRLMNDADNARLVVLREGNILQPIDHMLTTLMDAQRRLGATRCDTKSVDSLRNSKLQISGSVDQFLYQVFDTLKLIIGIYRNYRGEG